MTPTDGQTDDHDIHDITALLDTYERALNQSDAQLAASCFTGDGVLMQPMLPTARGAGLARAYADHFARQTLQAHFTLDELDVQDGGHAYALTHSVGRITLAAGGAPQVGYRREMFLLRREAGAWKIARYLFNHDATPNEYAAAGGERP